MRTLITGSVPAQTIVDVAVDEKADLVMMATRGRGAGATGVDLGTVTDRVVHQTQVPVFVVPIRRASRDRKIHSIANQSAAPEHLPAPTTAAHPPASDQPSASPQPPAHGGGAEPTS